MTSLATYVACRIRAIGREQRQGGGCCFSLSGATPCSKFSAIKCCSRQGPTQPVRILECGAGTGLLAAHLLPLVHKLLQPTAQSCDSDTSSEQQQHKTQQHRLGEEEHGCGQQGEQRGPVSSCGVIPNESLQGACAQTCTQNCFGEDEVTLTQTKATPIFTYVASEPRQELQWCLRGIEATRVGCRAAMKQHCPQLVICCWMPFNVDWTEAIRGSCCAHCKDTLDKGATLSALQHRDCACQVQEYILVGHAEGGLVGRP